MSIETGLAWESYAVDDAGGTAREMDGHITQASFTISRGVQDITAISQSARATRPLLADLQDSATFLFDDATNSSFDVLATVGSFDGGRTVTRTHSGQTLASESLLTSVAWGRTQQGELTAATSLVLYDGTVPVWS